MRKILASAIAAIALLFGGVMVAAPAQAVWGTSVFLTSSAPNPNAWIKTTNMVGDDKILHVSETARNVRYFEPPSSAYYMTIQGPAGTFNNIEHGERYTPTKDGTYTVWLRQH